MAAKAYFNLGANLVNSGQNDAAAEFFKKSIEADPELRRCALPIRNLPVGEGDRRSEDR